MVICIVTSCCNIPGHVWVTKRAREALQLSLQNSKNWNRSADFRNPASTSRSKSGNLSCCVTVGSCCDEYAAIKPGACSWLQYLATNAWLLPSYTLRKVEDATAALRQRLDAAQAAARPKKRFGFSARSKGQAAAAVSPTDSSAQPAVPVSQPAAASAAKSQEDAGR